MWLLRTESCPLKEQHRHLLMLSFTILLIHFNTESLNYPLGGGRPQSSQGANNTLLWPSGTLLAVERDRMCWGGSSMPRASGYRGQWFCLNKETVVAEWPASPYLVGMGGPMWPESGHPCGDRRNLSLIEHMSGKKRTESVNRLQNKS